MLFFKKEKIYFSGFQHSITNPRSCNWDRINIVPIHSFSYFIPKMIRPNDKEWIENTCWGMLRRYGK